MNSNNAENTNEDLLSKAGNNHTNTLLVVDDNEISQKLLYVYLSKMGFKVLLSENGHSALEVLEQEAVNLIFMDLHMPMMDGYQTAESIRQSRSAYQQVPIIGLSADSMPDSLNRALEMGMNEYLIKPVQQDDLYPILKKWLPQTQGCQPEKPAAKLPAASIDELRSMLLNELPEHQQNLKQTLSIADYDHAFQIVHKIAGGSSYCELPTLENAARHLQQLIKNRQTADIDDGVAQLNLLIEATIKDLA